MVERIVWRLVMEFITVEEAQDFFFDSVQEDQACENEEEEGK